MNFGRGSTQARQIQLKQRHSLGEVDDILITSLLLGVNSLKLSIPRSLGLIITADNCRHIIVHILSEIKLFDWCISSTFPLIRVAIG